MVMQGVTHTLPAAHRTWRLFAAAPVNRAVRDAMVAAQRALAVNDWPVRWVDPARAHITLQFYGATDERLVPRLEEALAAIASAHAPFTVRVASVGAFPSTRRPRVLWLGLAGPVERLEALARNVSVTAAVTSGGDATPFKPHITLGRMRHGGAIAGFDAAAAAVTLPTAMLPVDRLQLIRSVLERAGPVYTVLAEWPFGASVGARPEIEIREHG